MTNLITEPLGNEVYAHYDGKRIVLTKKAGARTIAFIVLDADMLSNFGEFLQLVFDDGDMETWAANETL
jgi:hypothetical protein